MALILKLLLAHILGDFFLQPQEWVKHKEKKKLKSKWLYVHIAIHTALMFIVVWDFAYTFLILGIGVLHLVIDSLKLVLQKKETKRLYFFLDQFFHIVTIVMLASLFVDNTMYSDYVLGLAQHPNTMLLMICLLLLTLPTSIVMKTIFSKWDISKLTKGNKSLKDAGKYIGILERLLVFIFITAGHWEAVGFLITAKSVFRFGDLTASKERKLTEYILIGTLISFGIAISISLIYLKLKHYV